MPYRRLEAQLGVDVGPYQAGLRTASAATKTFATEAAAAGRKVDQGWEVAARGPKTYATAAERAQANVAAAMRRGVAAQELATEYRKIAAAATAGSAEQLAANRLVEVSQRKLVASGLEVEAVNGRIGKTVSSLTGLLSQVGQAGVSSAGMMASGFSRVQSAAAGIGASIGSVGTAAGALVVAVAARAGVKAFQELGAEVRAFQRVAGGTAEEDSKLVYALHHLGIEPDVAAKALGIFSRNLVDHQAKVQNAGVEIAHLKNGNVDLIGTLYNLADAYRRNGAGAEGTALALDLLGRGGAALIPVLARGREGLDEFFKAAQRVGLVMSQEDLEASRRLTLQTRQLHSEWEGLKVSFGRTVVPRLTGLVEGTNQTIADIHKTSEAHGRLAGVVMLVAHALGYESKIHLDAKGNILGTASAQETAAKTADELKTSYAALGIALDDSDAEMLQSDKTAEQLRSTIASYKGTMAQTAAAVGISAAAMADAIGISGKRSIDQFDADIAAAKAFAQAVSQAVDATSSSFLRDVDAISHFSASSLESAAKAANRAGASVEKSDDRVGQATQRLADLQESFADQAAEARQRWAEQMAEADKRVAKADDDYAETVRETNDKISESEQRVADLRVSEAERVADVIRRTEKDNADAHQRVLDAQQSLLDLQERNAARGNPALEREVAMRQELRHAQDAVSQAQAEEAQTRQKGVDAVADAEKERVQRIADVEKTLQRTREEGAKSVARAEEQVTEARAAQVKLEEEGLHLGELTKAQQRQLRDAVNEVTKAQQEESKAAGSSVAAVTDAITVSVADIKKFYEDSLTEGQRFAEGIRTAIAKGYDPGFVSRLLQEGPHEAAPILAAIVSDQDNTLRDLVNQSEEAIRKQNFELREISRLTAIASKSTTDQMDRDLSDALAIMEANSRDGGRRTADAIAEELGIGTDKVRRISSEFGIALADGVNPVLYGVGAAPVDPRRNPNAAGPPSYNFGGWVPGYGNTDIVPAMLTPGEVVMSKPAVEFFGADQLLAMNAHGRRMRGYATGGFVTADDVPLPPDLSAYGDKVGYAGTKVDRYAHDKVVAWLAGDKSRSSAAPPSGGGPAAPEQVTEWVKAGVALAGRPESWVTPEVNIAMFESSGDPHAQNNWDSNAAAGHPSKGLMQTIDSTFNAYKVEGHDDIWNPVDNVAAATNYIAARYGDPWNTPGERSIAAGGPYKGYSRGGLVHAGVMDSGGWVMPGLNMLWNGLGVPEPVIAPSPVNHGPAGGGDVVVNVTVHGPALGTTARDIAEHIAEPLRTVYAARNDRSNGRR